MNKPGFLRIVCIALLFSAATVIASPAQTTFKTLASLGGSEYVTLVQGFDGELYGTTYNYVIFKVTTGGTLTTLSPPTAPADAEGDSVLAGLALATDGNFYGTTWGGGSGGRPTACHFGCGVIFEISQQWAWTLLHTFDAFGSEGVNPYAPVVQGTDGDFYGTASRNDDYSATYGTVFKVTPEGTLTVLHSFDGTDGSNPYAGMVQATDGNFYGTTNSGGTNGLGTVFKMTLEGVLTVLHSFNGADGSSLYAGLVQANDGNLYGTTSSGGVNGLGTIFKITPEGVLTVLHSFNGADGASPTGTLVQATDGNFYGTTDAGGTFNDGTVFKITPEGVLTVLHSFNGTDGSTPLGGLMQATNGTFYGTANGIFSLSVGLGPFVETLPTSGSVGASVVILGNNLTGTTGVSFHGVPAAFQVVSSTEVTATVPAGATTGTVQVTNAQHGTLQSNVPFRVTPRITFEPLSGPVGTVVTITGVGLSQTTGVSIAGANATSFTMESDRQVTAIVPTNATTGPIAIVTPSSTIASATNFAVSAATWTLKNASPITEYSSSNSHACSAMNVTAGDLLLSYNILYNGTSYSTSGITLANSDTQGNIWTIIQTETIRNLSILQIQYARAKASGSDTIEVSSSSSVNNLGNGCEEWSGGSTSGPILDGSAGINGAGRVASASATTTGFSDLVIGFCTFPWDNGSNFVMGAGAGYTQDVFNNWLESTSVFAAGVAGAKQTASCTTAGPSSNWSAIIAGFLSSAGT